MVKIAPNDNIFMILSTPSYSVWAMFTPTGDKDPIYPNTGILSTWNNQPYVFSSLGVEFGTYTSTTTPFYAYITYAGSSSTMETVKINLIEDYAVQATLLWKQTIAISGTPNNSRGGGHALKLSSDKTSLFWGG